MSELKTERFGDVEIPFEVGGLYDRYRMEPDLDEIAKLPGVEDVAFFRDQEKSLASFQYWEVMMPAFYYDLGFSQAVFLADLEGLRRLLPTDTLQPLAIWPGTGLLAFTAFEYRVTDIDPYNEFSIAVITHRPGSRVPGLVSALVSQVRRTNWAFVWKLPVTTELAWHGGKAGYNYPKYVTEVPWNIAGDEVTAEIRNGDAMEVRLVGSVLPTRPGKVVVNHAMSFQDGNVLDVPIRVNPRAQASSTRPAHCRLELGEGPIADVLRTLSIGRMVRYDFVPSAQSILPAGRKIG
jgi:hypothetical protein